MINVQRVSNRYEIADWDLSMIPAILYPFETLLNNNNVIDYYVT